jgi:hypothetical protein
LGYFDEIKFVWHINVIIEKAIMDKIKENNFRETNFKIIAMETATTNEAKPIRLKNMPCLPSMPFEFG